MRVYLASPHTLARFRGGVEWMIVYLAGFNSCGNIPKEEKMKLFWRGGSQDIGFTRLRP